jgi:hypothetical protein
MEVNFIITCHDKEIYYPYLERIIRSFKIIKPYIALAYNGNKKLHPMGFEPNFITDNKINGGRGPDNHPSGVTYSDADMELTVGGYEFLKNNNVQNWVKLSVDSWLIDEDIIIQILQEMKNKKCAYAGNLWYSKHRFSTDIIFANTEINNIFEDFKTHGKAFFDFLYEIKSPGGFEEFMKFIGEQYDRLIIMDREPLTPNITRWGVDKLGWTMKHDLHANIEFYNNYKPCNYHASLTTLSGSGIPFDLEPNKQHI